MYLNHFNLTDKPFQITPDPRFLWLGEKHQEALATLRYGVLDCKGFLLLTGDVGTGKTTLIKALLNSLDNNTVVATVVDPNLEKLEFFNFLGRIFGLKEVFTKKVDFLSRFTQFLYGAYEEGKTVLLIIDEAQRLSKELLEEIRLLSNIEKQHKKLLNIFFVGQNEFNVLLMEDHSRALRQRITINYQIQPLTEAETAKYIDFRLRVAGTLQKIFDGKAIREVFKFSKGYPRLINIICDHALLTAFVRDINKVPPSVVKECAKELTLPGEKPSEGIRMPPQANTKRSRWLPKAAFCISLLFVLVTGGYLIDPVIFSPIVNQVKVLYRHLAAGRDYLGSNRETTDIDPVETEASQTPHNNDPQAAVFRAFPVGSENRPLRKEVPEDDIKEETIQPVFPKETAQHVSKSGSHEDNSGDSLAETVTHRGLESPIFLANDAVFFVPFNYDTNELSPQAHIELDRLAAAMAQNPGEDIVVTGYTDTLGSHHYNVKLSQFRAEVVKSYLVAKGITPSRILTIGRAAENPLKTNDTSAGRAANRRVEIRLKPKSNS